MKKLTAMADSPLASDVIERLRAAGIPAEATQEESFNSVYVGGPMNVTIWIDDDSDKEHAEEILAECRLRASPNECPGCGYDLHGHAGEAICPECGGRVYAGEEARICPQCGEECPGSFEACWNCGSGLDGSETTPVARLEEQVEVDKEDSRWPTLIAALVLIVLGTLLVMRMIAS
jgi:hypothetical protein